MEGHPIIAVIITCFNYESYVSRAIESVVSQNVSGYEIVVVDDGSTDRSWDVIQKTGVVAYQIPNGGQRLACLYGLGKTRAPFVLFLDADDELLPGALERIRSMLDPGVAKVQFCLTCIDAAGHLLVDRYPALEAFRNTDKVVGEILRSGVYQTPPTSGNVFRRDVCELLEHCEYDNAVDGVILLAAPFMGEIVSLPDSLGLYRIHGNSDSGLGRNPQILTIERDLRRFRYRLAHLRKIIKNIRTDYKLVEAEATYYYNVNLFYASIFSGSRCSIRNLMRLFRALLREPRRRKWKATNMLFFLLVFLAPLGRAQALLAFRLSIGHRSVLQFLRAVVADGRLRPTART